MTKPATPEDIANVCKLLERLRTGEMNLIPSVATVGERKQDGSTELLQRVEFVLTDHLRRMQAPIGDGGTAFPNEYSEAANGDVIVWAERGMSLRDYFAIHEPIPFNYEGSGLSLNAMQKLLPENPMPSLAAGITLEFIQWEAEAVARYRYMRADAMLKARQE